MPRIYPALSVILRCAMLLSFVSKTAGATELELKSFRYEEGFEEHDPFVFWTTDGTYTTNVKGVTEEKAFSGKKSFKLDVTFHDGQYSYWYIPLRVPVEGRLEFSARLLIAKETTGHVGLGFNFCFPPTDTSGCQPFKYRSSTHGKWILIKGDVVGLARRIADDAISKYNWAAKRDNVGIYTNLIGLFLRGKRNSRVVLYLDDLRLEGDIPVEAGYQQEIKRRWAPCNTTLQAQIADWSDVVGEIEENVRATLSGSSPARQVARELESQILSLKKQIDKVKRLGLMSPSQHDTIESIISQLRGSIEHVVALGEANSVKNAFVYIVNPISSVKILPHTWPIQGKAFGDLSIVAARGEYEPASFVLRPLGDLEGLRITASDLKDGKGRIVPASNVDVKVVKCWYQAGGAWDGVWIHSDAQRKRKVLVPELLLNDDSLVKVDHQKQDNYLKLKYPAGEKYVCISSREGIPGISNRPTIEEFPVNDSPTLLPVDIRDRENQQFWVTVKVPQDVAPGIYRGSITLSTAKEPLGEINLRLKVLPFTLSPPKTNYDPQKDFICNVYYRAKIASPPAKESKGTISSEYKNENQFRAELSNLWSHGITNPTVYQWLADLETVLKIRDEMGMGRQPLYILSVKAEGPISLLKKTIELARSYGIREVYFYGIDEARGEELQSQRLAWKAVHQAGGKVFVAGHAGDFELVGDVLDLEISAGKPSRKRADQWHSAGHEIWMYANPQGGVENPELYRRNYGLELWKANYDGACTYVYQHGFGNAWNDFDHFKHRDHNFTYPTADGVIDTIAWEGYREAFDDIRYACTLRVEIENAKRRKNKEKMEIALAAEHYLKELDTQMDLDTVRSKIIDYIVTLMQR